MARVHDELRTRLGSVGAWTFAFDAQPVADVRAGASALEELGYTALWVPEGSGSRDVLTHLSLLLPATDHVTVASGIANVTARQPDVLQAGMVTLADGFGERPVFGIGDTVTSTRRARAGSTGTGRSRACAPTSTPWMRRPRSRPPPRRLAVAGSVGRRHAAPLERPSARAHSYFVPVSQPNVRGRSSDPSPYWRWS